MANVSLKNEINEPLYFEHGGTNYKILSPTEAIGVSTANEDYGITKCGYDNVIQMIAKGGKPITKEKFNASFTEVQSWITLQAFLASGISDEATQEEKDETWSDNPASDVLVTSYEIFNRNNHISNAVKSLAV